MTAKKGRAFSHKVRTGCTTCKQRRIKCDEGKPICTRCIKGDRTCLGYDVPRANIFSIEKPSLEEAGHKTLTLALTKQTRPPNPTPDPSCITGSSLSCGLCPGRSSSHSHTSSTSSSNLGSSPSSTSSHSSSSEDDTDDHYLRSIILRPNFGFGNEEESRSLDHWLLRTSPMLSHYGPMGDFFTIVVPQLAWASPSIRHMLVALSMTHEKFMRGVAYASTQTQARALSHYVSAITELRTRPPPQIHVLAAALLAWTMEMMQNNYPAALVHLKASRSILSQCESAEPPFNRSGDDLIHKSLRPTAMLAQGLTAIVLRKGQPTGEIESGYQEHLLSPWIGPRFASIVEARDAICECIEKIASLASQAGRDDPALQEMEIALSAWFDGVRKWDQEMVPSPSLVGLILLFNIAMALLPGQDVAGYSYSVNPATVDFVVEKASLLLDVTTMNIEDDTEAVETVRLGLEFVVRFFPRASSRAQALQLLRQINVGQSDQASGQTAKIRSKRTDAASWCDHLAQVNPLAHSP